MKNVLIGGAWPNANGPLHIGHIAALLPGDLLARYHRARGDRVLYVSGSDCHGTPTVIRAREEGKTPEAVSDYYHAQFEEVFAALGFSYDMYTRTSAAAHVEFVTAFHKRIYGGQHVYEKDAAQAHCPRCGKNLTDRLVEGACPRCGSRAKGEQCDVCGAPLEAEQLNSPACGECGGAVTFLRERHLYIRLSEMEDFLAGWAAGHGEWRKNALDFTARYIREGLRDRALTRSTEWGIAVPKPGFEDKKIYVWAENVLGYLSAGAEAAGEKGYDFRDFHGENALSYYVHGKDNIPFHTIIYPALLRAYNSRAGETWRLPDRIVSSGHVTLEGRKISTSGNHAVWAHELTGRHNPDAVRYFFFANGPERRDADFSYGEFYERNDGELLGNYGNLVHRTLSFIEKYLGGVVPETGGDAELEAHTARAFEECAAHIEGMRFKDALETAFDLSREANRFFDRAAPWKTRTSDPEACAGAIKACADAVASLAALLAPFLPFSSAKIAAWLGTELSWGAKKAPPGRVISGTGPLFERLCKR